MKIMSRPHSIFEIFAKLPLKSRLNLYCNFQIIIKTVCEHYFQNCEKGKCYMKASRMKIHGKKSLGKFLPHFIIYFVTMHMKCMNR